MSTRRSRAFCPDGFDRLESRRVLSSSAAMAAHIQALEVRQEQAHAAALARADHAAQARLAAFDARVAARDARLNALASRGAGRTLPTSVSTGFAQTLTLPRAVAAGNAGYNVGNGYNPASGSAGATVAPGSTATAGSTTTGNTSTLVGNQNFVSGSLTPANGTSNSANVVGIGGGFDIVPTNGPGSSSLSPGQVATTTTGTTSLNGLTTSAPYDSIVGGSLLTPLATSTSTPYTSGLGYLAGTVMNPSATGFINTGSTGPYVPTGVLGPTSSNAIANNASGTLTSVIGPNTSYFTTGQGVTVAPTVLTTGLSAYSGAILNNGFDYTGTGLAYPVSSPTYSPTTGGLGFTTTNSLVGAGFGANGSLVAGSLGTGLVTNSSAAGSMNQFYF